ncbi:uncharacterized protein BJ212DRAFT_1579742 [Suillus subaureus]|uniref:Uncharacterized protein n=1 Tax=Suillus subaureus TaxID=48587 RepID=A0A9P7E2L6_9AGAM|nr:uncharacterized protein BJ212DRAFT_1579742 [Suillus subaureus]KAG1809159.1 hypothetical protein BJ212DRAFT_1579742 [Suillus subaureus]
MPAVHQRLHRSARLGGNPPVRCSLRAMDSAEPSTTAIYLTVAPPHIPNVLPGLSPPPHITPLSRRQLTDSQIIPPLLAPTDPITFAALVPSAPPTEPITFAALVTSVHPALIPSAPPAVAFSAPPAALIPSTPPAALVFGFCAVHAPTLCFDLTVHLFHAH